MANPFECLDLKVEADTAPRNIDTVSGGTDHALLEKYILHLGFKVKSLHHTQTDRPVKEPVDF